MIWSIKGRSDMRPALFLCLLLAAGVRAQEGVRLEFQALPPATIQERLDNVPRTLASRQATLLDLFHQAGCETSEQHVPGSKAPNLICTMTGQTEDVIVVGGHYDFIDKGAGAVDDWSGAVLLPSLYESLKSHTRRHRYVFIAFAGEEDGLYGSKEYVKKLSREQKGAIHAMINLECLGTTPPKVWATRADKGLLAAYARTAQSLKLAAVGSNVDKVGDDDSHPFLDAKIPVLTIHSITQDTIGLLHSSRDTVQAIHPNDYYDAYRLAETFLALLDSEIQ